MLRCVLGLGCRQKLGYFLWNFVPNSGLRKFRHGIPTVGECDINCDIGQTGVYGTSGGDGSTADVHGTYAVWLKLYWFDFLSICCGFVVQHAVQQVTQQIEPIELEPIQPTTIAGTEREAVYIAQWSIEHDGHRRAVPSA